MKKEWVDIFQESFQKFCGEPGQNLYNYLGDTIECREGDKNMTKAMLDYSMAKDYDSDLDELHTLIDETIKSPIELAFLSAFVIIASNNGSSVDLTFDGCKFLPFRFGGQLGFLEKFNITLQKKINNYKVDFYIETERPADQFQIEYYFKKAETPYKPVQEAVVIVECDGHDYHERNKKQASHDKKRDRVLQSLGYNVLRFTGSDLWDDVFRHAEEVHTFLNKKFEKNCKDCLAHLNLNRFGNP